MRLEDFLALDGNADDLVRADAVHRVDDAGRARGEAMALPAGLGFGLDPVSMAAGAAATLASKLLGGGDEKPKLRPDEGGPMGTHYNVELAAKLASARDAQRQGARLISDIDSAMPKGDVLSDDQNLAPVVDHARGARDELVDAVAAIQDTLPDLQKSYDNFGGSTNAWTEADRAELDARRLVAQHRGVAAQLATSVARARADRASAAAIANARALERARAQKVVDGLIQRARESAARNDFIGAHNTIPAGLSVSSDPVVRSELEPQLQDVRDEILSEQRAYINRLAGM